MKLFYYKTVNPSRNFGDELNQWLWPRLLDSFDDCPKNIFIGIGTLINDALPQWMRDAENIIFFSSGVGYGRSLRVKPDANWRIYCVRGPLSARKLKLPPSLAITDGAALLKRYFAPYADKDRTYRFSYIPHFRHGSPYIFQPICSQIGIHYIDPAGEVDDVIADILRSRVVISEAMHGAIIADALRVPWIPVRTNPNILPLKWLDWCQSINVPYTSEAIKGVKQIALRDYLYPVRLYLQGQSSIRHLLDGFGMSTVSQDRLTDSLAAQLENITKTTPYLSDESHLESLVIRLEEQLDILRKDIRKGLFN